MRRATAGTWLVISWVFRAGRGLWLKITVDGAIKVAALAMTIFLILGVYNTQKQREISDTNREILYSIEQQTSPEAVAERDRTIDAIIEVVDCRNQASLQRVIDVLVERKVLKEGDARAITTHCEEFVASED